MRSLFSLATFVAAAQALYFYVDGGTPKCFYEELPKDTLVVGHYSAEEWDAAANMWQQHQGISIYITVEVCALARPISFSYLYKKGRKRRRSVPSTNDVSMSVTNATNHVGSLRQQPPCRLPTRHLLRPIHLLCRRRWRPQDLLHALIQQRPHWLALNVQPQWRHQAAPRHGDWRDQPD